MKIKTLQASLLIFFLLVLSNISSAQSIDSLKLDSLIYILTLEKDDEQTVDAYLSLASEYENASEYMIAMTYSNLGKDLADKINYSEAEFKATLKIAHFYAAYYMDFENALRYYDEGLKLAEESGSKEDLLAVYRGYSSLYAGVDQFEEAVRFNGLSIDIAKELNDDQLVSELNAYGGSIYEEKGDTSKAIEMYKEVLRIEEENRYINSSKAALATIAHYYFLEGDFDKSLDQYRIALKKFQRLKDNRWVSYIHAEMSNVYLKTGNIKRAEQHALEGYGIAKEFELNKERADNLYMLSQVYKAKGNKQKEKEYTEMYQNLMDSVLVELAPRSSEQELAVSEGAFESDIKWYSGFLQAILIAAFIAVFVFISGLSVNKG